MDFVLNWLSLSEKEGGWDWADRAADGMSLAVLIQRQNLFFHLPSVLLRINSNRLIQKYSHFGYSNQPNDVVYASADSLAAYRDISRFFPSCQFVYGRRKLSHRASKNSQRDKMRLIFRLFSLFLFGKRKVRFRQLIFQKGYCIFGT